MKDCHQNAIRHPRLSMYGPPCGVCGRPVRTPRVRVLRVVHGAGWGMWWVMALVVGWRKAIRSFWFRSGLRLKATTAFGRAEGVRVAPCDANNA